MSYCQYCGAKLAPETKFCEECGSPATDEKRAMPIGTQTLNRVDIKSKAWSIGRLFSGRLGRMHYFEGGLLAYAPFLFLVFVWGVTNIITGTMIFGGSATAVGTNTSFAIDVINNTVVPILFAVAFIFFISAYFSLATRRCHDFGQRGWISIGTFIPYVGFIVGLYLLFKKGDADTNKFGPPPQDRKFLADVFNYVS